ncbi:MAG: hypothetical protein Kow0077_11300 [Anaerolineae bacterium]
MTEWYKHAWKMLAGLAFGLVMLAGSSVLAQGGGELRFGQPIDAALPVGAAHAYTFRSEGQDALTVRMTARTDGLDPVLVLFGPQGELLAFNDDATPGQRDAALENVPLLSEGVYTLVARSYGRRSGGEYRLEATTRRTETLDGTAPLAIGETVEAELFVVGQVDRWVFEGQAGQVISARMDAARGSQLDPLLELLAADGTILTYSDDEGGDKNSLINGFTLPVDGPYVLVARAWGNLSSGEYTLQLAEGVLAPDLPLATPYTR